MDRAARSEHELTHGSNVAGVAIAVEHVPLASLLPPRRVLRKHSPRQLKRLARSLRDYGFLVPIVVDGDTRILAGQGRAEAARLLGLNTVPVVRAEHLTEAQARLFAIADNEVPRGVEYVPGALVLELKDIQLLEPQADLTSSALSIVEIDTMFGRARTDELAERDDALPEPETAVVSVLGDCWRLSDHVLGCGDARDAAFVARLMDGRTARILLTDSPWNLKIEGVVSGKGKTKHDDFVMGAGEMTRDTFVRFLADALAAAETALMDGALLYCFIDWRSLDALATAATERGLVQQNLLVWCKDNAGLGGLYRSQHELVALYKHGRAPHLNNIRMGQDGRNRTNCLFYPGANTFVAGRAKALEMHPTSKPVAIIADLILDATAPGDVVLDTFGGSGSTLIAAHRTGRTCCMVELDPSYVDGIVRRFEVLTGVDAVHVETELTFAEVAARRLRANQENVA